MSRAKEPRPPKPVKKYLTLAKYRQEAGPEILGP
jgi:hypothetical protein